MSDLRQALYLIADEMRGMATIGNHFANNIYEVERAHRIMELAAKIAALADDEPLEMVKAIFDAEPWGRISPAIGAEAAVFNAQNEILLIQRSDNHCWAMPGGVAEIGQTPSEAVLRELWEEAGLRGRVERLLGVFDGRFWGLQSKVHSVLMVFLISCDDLTSKPGLETIDAKFFKRDQLPENMHAGHGLRIPKVFELLDKPVYFDPAQSYDDDMPIHQRPNEGN